jgi:hypothetical protein
MLPQLLLPAGLQAHLAQVWLQFLPLLWELMFAHTLPLSSCHLLRALQQQCLPHLAHNCLLLLLLMLLLLLQMFASSQQLPALQLQLRLPPQQLMPRLLLQTPQLLLALPHLLKPAVQLLQLLQLRWLSCCCAAVLLLHLPHQAQQQQLPEPLAKGHLLLLLLLLMVVM